MLAKAISIHDANENPTLCSSCGGKCCKQMPGITHPEDWGLPSDTSRLEAALNSGRWAIDWWEGDPENTTGDYMKDNVDRAFYVRPATQGNEGLLMDASWGGACTFHSEIGCTLSTNDRPKECRDLKPAEGGSCSMTTEFTKRNAAIAWLPYNDFLYSLS
jgi:hypothetical protein